MQRGDRTPRKRGHLGQLSFVPQRHRPLPLLGRTENLPLEIWQMFVRTPKPIPYTPRQVYLRTLIGAGTIRRVWRNVKVDGHAEEVLAAVDQL